VTEPAPLVCLLASACGGVERRLRSELLEPALARGWRVAVTLTPTAGAWFAAAGELARCQRLTDLPVRHAPRRPGEAKPYPLPDAFVFAPASANTVAKLALGIGDNQALTQGVEAVGSGRPLVLRPWAGPAQRGHPAFAGHLATLTGAGVTLAEAPAEEPLTPLLDALAGLLNRV
jgi:hypothetical protein